MKVIKQFFWVLILSIICVHFSYSQKGLYTPLEFQQAYENKTRSYDGKPGQSYWQNYAEYTIEAEVIPESSMLQGKEDILFYNNSPDTLWTIIIHLHQDMYKKGNPRERYIVPSDITNGINIYDLIINGEGIQLDDEEIIKRQNSLIKLKLNNPLLPNSTLKVTLKWDFHIPEKTFIRTARFDSTSFFIAYWYPRIAVYDDVFGWDQFGYEGKEFNNDFGSYNVIIKLSEQYNVWSTGELINADDVLSQKTIDNLNKLKTEGQTVHILDTLSSKGNNTSNFKEWIFEATHTKDFAFGISDHHLWDAVKFKVKDAKEIVVNVVYHPDAKKYFEVMPEFLKACVSYFSENNPGINYPYSHYTAFNGLNKGWHSAMEFPALSNYSYYEDDTINYSMFCHELAHNYFPFYININEAQFAWLDEGLTTYFEYDIMRSLLSIEKFDVWEKVHPLDIYSGQFFDIPPFTSSLLYEDVNSTQTAYYRPSFAFIILEDVLGKEMFIHCLSEFISRWNGKRPIPHDLFYTFNDICGQDLTWFWNPWFFEFGYPDLAIEEVTDNKIIVKKVGNLPVPISLQITYSNNTKEEVYHSAEIWKNGDDIIELRINPDKQIKKILLSNRFEIPDINRNNNIYITEN